MKLMRLVFSIFFVVGVGLLVGSFFTIQHTRNFLKTAVPAQGVVVEMLFSQSHNNQGTSWSYYPHVRFRTADGRDFDFVGSVGSNPPSYSVNQPVTVLYDPDQPSKASLNSFGSLWVTTIILVSMGLLFIAPGTGFMVWKRFSDRKNAWLHQNGRRVLVAITNVELNTSLEVNGRNPYRIICQWLDPARNEMHVFHSANIWYDPSDFLQGKQVEVLMDPENPRRYTMDTSFLPKVV